MALGWRFIEPLENISRLEGITLDNTLDSCKELSTLNDGFEREVLSTLRSLGHNKQADKIQQSLKKPKNIYNLYFGNQAEPLNEVRASLIFKLSLDLQRDLIRDLVNIPNSQVTNSNSRVDRNDFINIYRFTNWRSVTSIIKSVQFELERFYRIATNQDNENLPSVNSWIYDSEFMFEQVLFGYPRSGSIGLLNSDYQHSPVVAAGVIRSFLESVLFQLDFTSSIEGINCINEAKWDDALKKHLKSGTLNQCEYTWAYGAYRKLSSILHNGDLLTYGEIWMLGQVVEHIRNRLAQWIPRS